MIEHPDITFYNRTGMTREQWKKRNEPIEETGTKEKTPIDIITNKVSKFNRLVEKWELENNEQIKVFRSLDVGFYLYFTNLSTFLKVSEGHTLYFEEDSGDFPFELTFESQGVLHKTRISRVEYENEIKEMLLERSVIRGGKK